jgi:hypothetical protein
MTSEQFAMLLAAIGMIFASIAYAIRVYANVRMARTEMDKIEVDLSTRVFESWEIDKLLPEGLRLHSIENSQAAPQRWMLTDDGEIMEVRDAP